MVLKAYDTITTYFGKNPLRISEAKEAGRKVVGTYCIYTPNELIMAAGAIPVSLCGTRNDSIPAAEAVLPRGLCPLIKSSYGFLLEDSCPYLAAADLIVADTTCDGKKKMFELMAKEKPMHILQLPHNQDANVGLPYWKEQLKKLHRKLEETFDVEITEQGLREAIQQSRRERFALKRVFDTAAHTPSPISGMHLLEIAFKTSFFPDKEEGIALLNELADELEQEIAAGRSPFAADAPRIILTGVPTGVGSHKVIKLLEECGASVVCLDNCTGYKKTRNVPEACEDGDMEAIFDSMASSYLSIPCSIMSPNPNRFSTLRELANFFHADAVVDLTWQGCHTYNVESYNVKNFVNIELGLPSLHLETDFSESDTEQLRVRIDAFLELVSLRKSA